VKSTGAVKGIAIIAGCIWSISVIGQVTPEKLQHFLSDAKKMSELPVKFPPQIKDFYLKQNYKTAWIHNENKDNRNFLFNELKEAAFKGLNENDYQYEFILSFKKNPVTLQNIEDSLKAEILLTDAALHFYHDIVFGNTKPLFRYEGLKYSSACEQISDLLAAYVSNNSLPLLSGNLSHELPEIISLERKIRWISAVIKDSSFRETTVTSQKVNTHNKPLVLKLFQLGITDSIFSNVSDSLVKQFVKEAQKQFGLLADGVMKSTFLTELNVPLSIRRKQLNLSVNYYRWLYCQIQNQSVIVVNIPAAYLKVYRDNKAILEMRMIVGKKSTPTPALTSVVNEVVLYPYWHVPYSIATKELLPAIKKNPGYIHAGNYQVLNMAGKILNPYSINWSEYSTKNFPFVIRQSTGCDNALGLLKLDFYNPFGVYLHDTPTKPLFLLNKRFFSHGCMRMEKPMEIGHLILKNNVIAIDTLEQKGCLRNQSPIVVPADEQIPVIIWYNPAGTDSTGRVIYYEDVYRKFEWRK